MFFSVVWGSGDRLLVIFTYQVLCNSDLANEFNIEIGLLPSSLCIYQGISAYFVDMQKKSMKLILTWGSF